MSDNPFDEPSDNERTVIRPMPGGGVRRGDAPAAPPASPANAAASAIPPGNPAEPARALNREGPDLPLVGASPLLAAAAPLLQLMGRLRTLAGNPDPGSLRELANQELARFRAAVDRLDLPGNDRRDAHFALCAAIDDIVMNTAWGTMWSRNSLVAANHGNVEAGEGFFLQLDARQRDPVNHRDLLSLMYVCLSLGFQGRYRVLPRGVNQLEELRSRLYDSLKRVGAAVERGLSPRWQGVEAPYVPSRASVPGWVIGAGVATVLAILFLLLSFLLGGSADIAFANAGNSVPVMPQIQRPEVRRPPPPPPPPPPGPSVAATLRRFLEPEIRAGLVGVEETAALTTVRIKASGMFASGSATLQTSFVSLLHRIGDALNTEPGRVLVVGHTDNQPIRTARFPSNYQLSVARAEAAGAVIGQKMREPARLTAEGRADQVPIANNDTAEGREANRRIEVVLRRQEH